MRFRHGFNGINGILKTARPWGSWLPSIPFFVYDFIVRWWNYPTVNLIVWNNKIVHFRIRLIFVIDFRIGVFDINFSKVRVHSVTEGFHLQVFECSSSWIVFHNAFIWSWVHVTVFKLIDTGGFIYEFSRV